MLKTRYNFLLCVGFVESMFTSEGSFTYGQYIFPDSTEQSLWVYGGHDGSSVLCGFG